MRLECNFKIHLQLAGFTGAFMMTLIINDILTISCIEHRKWSQHFKQKIKVLIHYFYYIEPKVIDLR